MAAPGEQDVATPEQHSWEGRVIGIRGAKKAHVREADHLSRCVLERAPRNDCSREFVEHRFRFPLANYRGRSTSSAAAHVAINLATAALGLATASIVSLAGASSPWKGIVIGIGLVVGVLSGVNQLFQFGQRNLAFARTWLTLRAEGWRYVWALDDYGPRSSDTSAENAIWALFVSRVITIQQDAEKVSEPGGAVLSTPPKTAEHDDDASGRQQAASGNKPVA